MIRGEIIMDYIKKFTVLSLILVLALTVFGCGSTEVKEEVATTIPVETVEVKQGDFTNTIILSGTTKPIASVTVIPKIAGAEKITSIRVQEGDRVSAGQIIATLDQSTVDIQLNLAQVTYNDALKNYERQKVLYEAGAIPQATFEQIETGLAQAESNLTAQQMAYDNTLVKAPISGLVTAVLAEVGTLGSAQTPIAQIADIDTLELITTINEMQVNKLRVNDQVEIMIPALDKEIFKGTITSISSVMEDRLKAYPVTITLNNKDHKIKAGMYAEVEIVTDVEKDALIIPAQAIITRDGLSTVYVVKEGKALQKEVIIGLSDGKETVILEGLELGEEVIIRGNDNVVTGDLVSVVNRGEK
jgi:cobalt-zinc-cadmium efflux system membrane fusion protein